MLGVAIACSMGTSSCSRCEADVRGQRSRRRQRKRWIDVVKYNMEDLRLDLIDVDNRAEWRQKTSVADPLISPEKFTV